MERPQRKKDKKEKPNGKVSYYVMQYCHAKSEGLVVVSVEAAWPSG